MKTMLSTLILSLSTGHVFAQTTLGPCGQFGSIEERILSCGTSKDSFLLVTRSDEGKEIFLDSRSNLLWGDSLITELTHSAATNTCSTSRKLGRKWRLPSISEFQRAESVGVRKLLPNMKSLFWSSTAHEDYYEFSWLFDGRTGEVSFDYRIGNSGFVSARCVSPL